MPLSGRLPRPLQHLAVGLNGNGVAPGAAAGSAWTKSGASWGIGTASAVATAVLPAATVSAGEIAFCGILLRTTVGAATALQIIDGTNGAGKDSANNSWALIAGATFGVGTVAMQVWASTIANSSSTDVITWTWATNTGAASSAAFRTTGGSLTLDGSVVVNNGSATPLSTGALSTSFNNDLFLVFEGQVGNTAFTAPAFNPLGTDFVRPDADFQATGASNNHSHFSSIIANFSGAQAFSDTVGAGTWVAIAIPLKHG